MTDLPSPPVPAACDLRNLDGFMLNTERLLASELWALSTPEEFKAAFALWCRAWKQVPAASLPNDQRTLAAFAGISAARWPKVRDMALRGFYLCADGRLYHRTLAEDANRAAPKHEHFKARAKAAAEARWNKRLKDAAGNASSMDASSPSGIARGVLADAQGQGQGQGQDLENTPPPPPPGQTSPGRVEAGQPDSPAAAAAGSLRVGIDPRMVQAALRSEDLHRVVRAFGGEEDPIGWTREAAGLTTLAVAAILAVAVDRQDPIRWPSGLRAVRPWWDGLPAAKRSSLGRTFLGRYGVVLPAPAAAAEPAAVSA
jgi:uncharacterized protein YdaU (DUF1376 family)